MSTNEAVRPGRPLDRGVDEAVFAEVLRLVADEGLGAVSRRRVASGAGVSRQTLYNRWSTAGDMVLDALLDRAERSIGASDEPGDLRSYLHEFAGAIDDWAGPSLRAIAALAQSDAAFAERFRTHFLARRHAALTAQVRASVGESVADAVVERQAELVAGSMWFRLLIADLPLDDRWVDGMVEAITAATRP